MSDDTTKKGPVYSVDLTIDTLPIGGGMTQQLPSASDLARVKEVSERTAAGYEVLMAHYIDLRASLASAESRLAIAVEALEAWVQYDDADPQVKGECLREARERTALAQGRSKP